ncbi:hypothetical protein Avbf_13158 [Armadillidium vulgare]|nr:hypothetical protein Avbf_13158 [Armadillidium vulgare]
MLREKNIKHIRLSKAIEEKREKILWAAECLGYEQSITHCLYDEKTDPDINCTYFVGLKCANCDDKFYTINSNETLEVTSPGFPNVYNDNSICRWTIRKNNPSSFVVNIKYLSLPPRSLASIGITPHSFSAPEIAGITFSVLVLFVPIAIMLKYMMIKVQRKRNQRLLAQTLLLKVRPKIIFAAPRAQSAIKATPLPAKTTPLPAVPKKHCSKILDAIENQGSKSSISSGIYEDIFRNRESTCYLNLEEINKSEESKSSVNYDNFKIPTFVITTYNDDEKSCPSDMPSCSFTSDFDSVFASEMCDEESLSQPKPKRSSTYTIPKPKTFPGSNSCSISINVFAANKNKRFSDLQSSGQRCFSDSDVKTETKIPDICFNSLQKTYTQKFQVRD